MNIQYFETLLVEALNNPIGNKKWKQQECCFYISAFNGLLKFTVAYQTQAE